MPTFKDGLGREWSLVMNCAELIRIRNEFGTDPMAFLTTGLQQFFDDLAFRAKALWTWVRPAAEKVGVTEQSFLESISGDTFDAATCAMVDAIVDFSPSPEDRARLRAMIEAIKQKGNELADRNLKRLISIELGDGFLRQPEHLASILVHEPSASLQ